MSTIDSTPLVVGRTLHSDLPTLAHAKKIVEIRFVRECNLWHWLVIDENDRLYMDHGEFKSLDLAADDLRSVKGFA